MTCDKCKWAKWNRTSNGRLHPDKGGRCTKEIVIPELPEAFYWDHYGNKQLRYLSGGYIERGQEHRNLCTYYEEETK